MGLLEVNGAEMVDRDLKRFGEGGKWYGMTGRTLPPRLVRMRVQMNVRTYLLYIIFCVALLNRSKPPPGAASPGFVVDIITWQPWQTIGEES